MPIAYPCPPRFPNPDNSWLTYYDIIPPHLKVIRTTTTFLNFIRGFKGDGAVYVKMEACTKIPWQKAVAMAIAWMYFYIIMLITFLVDIHDVANFTMRHLSYLSTKVFHTMYGTELQSSSSNSATKQEKPKNETQVSAGCVLLVFTLDAF